MTYLGLDITAGVLPFRRRVRAAGVGGGGSRSEIVFCRLGLREDDGFAGSISGGGLGSRAGAFRFRDGGEGRFAGGATGSVGARAPVEALVEDSDELAALAEARVTRELEEDMSIVLVGWLLVPCQLLQN
jgi:hypothetical protein